MMETEFLDDAINRSVLVVRPAEPFKRWAAKMGGDVATPVQPVPACGSRATGEFVCDCRTARCSQRSLILLRPVS